MSRNSLLKTGAIHIAPVLSKELLDIQTITGFRFTLKRVRAIIITYSQMHRTDEYSQHSSIIWPGWRSDWVFVYELSGCGLESHCGHLNAFNVSADIADNFIKLSLVYWAETWHKKSFAIRYIFVYLLVCIFSCWTWYHSCFVFLIMCIVSTCIRLWWFPTFLQCFSVYISLSCMYITYLDFSFFSI